MKESTKNWLKIADKDLRMAELVFEGNEPLGTIYHLHACIEKLLKGICEENKGIPPKIHSLKRLAIDSCGIKLEKQKQIMFDLLDQAFIDSRYPKDVEEFESEYNIETCKDLIKEVKETCKWLKSLLNEK